MKPSVGEDDVAPPSERVVPGGERLPSAEHAGGRTDKYRSAGCHQERVQSISHRSGFHDRRVPWLGGGDQQCYNKQRRVHLPIVTATLTPSTERPDRVLDSKRRATRLPQYR